jgi:hypothetical protein
MRYGMNLGPDGLGRQDRLNWQIKLAGQEMTATQLREFAPCSGPKPAAAAKPSRALAGLST